MSLPPDSISSSYERLQHIEKLLHSYNRSPTAAEAKEIDAEIQKMAKEYGFQPYVKDVQKIQECWNQFRDINVYSYQAERKVEESLKAVPHELLSIIHAYARTDLEYAGLINKVRLLSDRFLLSPESDIIPPPEKTLSAAEAKLYSEVIDCCFSIEETEAYVNHAEKLISRNSLNPDFIRQKGMIYINPIGFNCDIRLVECNALEHASFYGHIRMLKVLLAAGASVNEHRGRLGSDDYPPLFLACVSKNAKNKQEAMRLLIDCGGNCQRVLMLLVQYMAQDQTLDWDNEFENIIKLLVQSGADPALPPDESLLVVAGRHRDRIPQLATALASA